MEFGIGTGAGIEADPQTRQRAVTDHILALADQAGYRAALIDAVAQGSGETSVITWPQFAHTVRAAASGLSRRGLREADTAGIFVDDAVSHVVAVHAVRAAGAIAMPIRPAQTAGDIAAQLKQGRARQLITSAALAELAIQAAERSWVRQVFAFGEAEGTTPFGSLLHTARHSSASHNGHNDHDRGGDAAAAQVLDPARLRLDGSGLAGPAGPDPRLTRRDVVVAVPPCGDPDAYTLLLDLALAAGATIVAAPPPPVTAVVSAYKGTAAIVPRGTDVPGLPAGRVLSVD